MERLQGNDAGAFEELVRAHGGHMLAVIRRYLPREEDAQDALQDAFVSAYRAVGRFAGQSRLGTWLHRIAVNAALMKLRAARSRPLEAAGGEGSIETLLPRFDGRGQFERMPQPWNLEALSGIERAEVRGMLQSALERLPEAYRMVVMLRDIEQLDTLEVAGLLGLTESAVKTRLHRARLALRELLAPVFADTSGAEGDATIDEYSVEPGKAVRERTTGGVGRTGTGANGTGGGNETGGVR